MSTLATAILDLLRAGHVVTVDQIGTLLHVGRPAPPDTPSWGPPRAVVLQALVDLVASGQARTMWDGGDSTRYALAAPAPPAPGRDYAGLAPCPTCGEDNGVIAEHMAGAALSMRWIIYCDDCEDTDQAPCGNGRTLSDAIRDWDRAAVAASLALLDARSCRSCGTKCPAPCPCDCHDHLRERGLE